MAAPKINGPRPTEAQFTALQGLYDYFNKALFGNKLPQCILNLSHKKGAHGYFWPNRWASAEDFKLAEGADENALAQVKQDAKTMHEISLVPESLARSPWRGLSTLVHEMCHLEREEFQKVKRGNYHDKKWAEMMLAVGLEPYNIKSPDKMTGQNCTHRITKGGRYDEAFKGVPQSLLVPFLFIPPVELAKAKKTSNKVKYTCPLCEAKAWGKPGSSVLCGDCTEGQSRLVKMLDDDALALFDEETQGGPLDYLADEADDQGEDDDVVEELPQPAEQSAGDPIVEEFDLEDVMNNEAQERNRMKGGDNPCFLCGAKVAKGKGKQIHLSWRTGRALASNDGDRADSQGFHSVGPDCAKKIPAKFLF